MIKTDNVIYRARTQKEYDWLMKKLEEAGCEWTRGFQPTTPKPYWENFRSDTGIHLENKKITYDDFYNYDPDNAAYQFIEVSDIMHPYKDTAGKPKLSLVPPQIIFDIAEVREYGNKKYPEGGKDEESGIEHYKHMACNLAFICEMERENEII